MVCTFASPRYSLLQFEALGGSPWSRYI
uniref:Uncharacterized protein n=1 Tax=Anguilla anguilla TaxID=7936 RepID=A0A0E9TP47_ANGAN